MGNMSIDKKQAQLAQKKHDAVYYVKVAIGLALMFGFQFITPPAPITQAGIAVFGAFLGLVFLMATVDMVWPTFASICMFAFYAKDIYPATLESNGIYEAVIKSFGHWITLFIIAMFILCRVLEDAGIMRRLVFWFVTRKFAKRGAWSFTFMLLLAAFVLSSFMDPYPAAMVMIMCAHEIFRQLGFEKGESWPCMVVACVVYTAAICFPMSPVGHNLPISILSLISTYTGYQINILTYAMISVPVCVVIWLLMFVYFKHIVKPDVSKFASVDYDVIEKLRPGKMDAKERIVSIISLTVLILWVLPGFLSLLAPESPVTLLLNDLTMLFPLLVALVLFAIIRIDGKPILDIAETSTRISWSAVYLNAGMFLIALALGEETTGFPQWMTENIVPLVSGVSPFLTIVAIVVLCVTLTNILNNWAVNIVFASVSAPIAAATNINPAILAAAIILGSTLAYTTPAASSVATFSVSDPYCNANYVLRRGLVLAVITAIVCCALIYPLGMLVV